MKCCLCKKEIEKTYNKEGEMCCEIGNNAEPLKSGRCCDECNMSKVIPARLKQSEVTK